MDYKNVYNENSSRFEERYSTMIIVAFIYYTFGYYIIEIQDKCKNLINWKPLAAIILFHIIQLTIAYKYWSEDKIMYAWGFILVPLIAFVVAKQYMNSYKKNAYMKMKAYMQKKEVLQESGPIFNQDTTPTGVLNEQTRMEQGRSHNPEILGVPPQQMAQIRMNQLRSEQVPAYGDYTNFDPDYEQQQLNQTIKGGNVYSMF